MDDVTLYLCVRVQILYDTYMDAHMEYIQLYKALAAGWYKFLHSLSLSVLWAPLADTPISVEIKVIGMCGIFTSMSVYRASFHISPAQ